MWFLKNIRLKSTEFMEVVSTLSYWLTYLKEPGFLLRILSETICFLFIDNNCFSGVLTSGEILEFDLMIIYLKFFSLMIFNHFVYNISWKYHYQQFITLKCIEFYHHWCYIWYTLRNLMEKNNNKFEENIKS